MPNDNPTATVTATALINLTSKPCKWIAVIRQGTKKPEVDAFTNGYPVFVLSDYGMFIVAIPGDQAWYADRLASGLFYAKVHDTYNAAEADCYDHADLVR